MGTYQDELLRIKNVLKENPKGMTITDVSREINLNRNSVAKYLEILHVSGQVEMQSFGPSKVYTPSQRIPISALLNLSTGYIVVLNRDLRVRYMNENFIDFTGMKREELIDGKIENTSPSLFSDEEILSKIRKALDGTDSAMERSFQKGRKEYYFKIKLMPTTFDNGTPGVTILSEDLTEWKMTNDALKERVKELNCLYGISELVENPDLSLEDILQKTVELIPSAWQYPEQTSARIILGDREYNTDPFNGTERGEKSPIVVHGEQMGSLEVYYAGENRSPFLEEEKNLLNAVAERLGKIVELKKAEKQLKFSEAKFRGLFENLFDGVYQTTSKGKILSANPALVRMLGYDSEEELCDVDIEDKIYTSSEKREMLIKELEEKGTLRNIELRLRRKDGSRINVLENAHVVRNEDGKVLYYEGTLTEVTEQKKV